VSHGDALFKLLRGVCFGTRLSDFIFTFIHHTNTRLVLARGSWNLWHEHGPRSAPDQISEGVRNPVTPLMDTAMPSESRPSFASQCVMSRFWNSRGGDAHRERRTRSQSTYFDVYNQLKFTQMTGSLAAAAASAWALSSSALERVNDLITSSAVTQKAFVYDLYSFRYAVFNTPKVAVTFGPPTHRCSVTVFRDRYMVIQEKYLPLLLPVLTIQDGPKWIATIRNHH